MKVFATNSLREVYTGDSYKIRGDYVYIEKDNGDFIMIPKDNLQSLRVVYDSERENMRNG